MVFNVNEFKSNVAANGGLLKNNRFAVLISKPNKLDAKFGDLTELRFYAESASVPGIALQTAEQRRQGVGNLEKTPWGAAFTDVSITFRIDQQTKTWNFFQAWMGLIYNYDVAMRAGQPDTEFELEYKDDYVSLISIFVYNEIDRGSAPIMTIDLYDAFPVSISDMQMSWGNSDIMRLNVTFNFRSWSLREKYSASLSAPSLFGLNNIDIRPALGDVLSTAKAIPNVSRPTNSAQYD